MQNNSAERRVGITRDGFLALFLDEQDFGRQLRLVQDTRLQGPDPGEREFPRFQGIRAGFAVWMGSEAAPVWRVVDIRWAFPTVWQARAFHLASLERNSEGAPPYPNAPTAGANCHVFGGPFEMYGIAMNQLYYLFYVRRIVVKFFVAQGPIAEELLTPNHVLPLVEKIVSKIEANTE